MWCLAGRVGGCSFDSAMINCSNHSSKLPHFHVLLFPVSHLSERFDCSISELSCVSKDYLDDEVAELVVHEATKPPAWKSRDFSVLTVSNLNYKPNKWKPNGVLCWLKEDLSPWEMQRERLKRGQDVLSGCLVPTHSSVLSTGGCGRFIKLHIHSHRTWVTGPYSQCHPSL